MKRKGIAAAVLAAAIILSGCSENAEGSLNSVAVGSAATLPSYSAPAPAAPTSTSTHTGAPTVVAPSFTDTSSGEPTGTTPETSTDAPENPTPVDVPNYGDRIIIKEDIYLERGDEYHVYSGEVVELDADMTVEYGGAIVVHDGGHLLVAETVKLEGTLELQSGGKLTMLNDDSMVGGSGAVVVGKSFDQIECGNGTIIAQIAPPEREVINGATYVGGIVIANKAITLPPEFGSHLAYDSAEPVVLEALAQMNNDAWRYYTVVSGYRDYWSQQAIFQRYCDRDGYEAAVTYSAKQGHSEHQTGYTLDLDSLYESYGQTSEGKWLAENCWKYGFIIRYPKGKEYITGYTYEPWHVRYVGRSAAKLIYDNDLTLEEFLGVEGGWEIVD